MLRMQHYTPLYLLSGLLVLFNAHFMSRRDEPIEWAFCGDNLQCANVPVPLDHNNTRDARTITIALTRYLATDQVNRKGSVFINPGGPGGSGTQWAATSGDALSTVLGGQYDIIGFDPRGVNQTKPSVSCFNSQLDGDVFNVRTSFFQLNLPGASSPNSSTVVANIQYQVSQVNSEISALAAQCYERTGGALAFMGTAAVVHDIDFLSKLIDGDNAPINYWGVSYGSLIGQYMTKILPPSRLGKMIIDGIINVHEWSAYAIEALERKDLDMDVMFRVFVSSCLAAQQNYTLNTHNFSSPEHLLDAISSTLIRITRWPLLASGLSSALSGNFTSLASLVKPWVSPGSTKTPDSSAFAQQIIFCDDSKPYDDARPTPTTTELTEVILRKLDEKPNWASQWFSTLLFCNAWDNAKLSPRRSRYNGTFEIRNSTLTTPILIISNTVDNITPLADAKTALDRFGSNARMIQQDGYGHTSLSVVSFCTLHAIRDYMLNGTLPSGRIALCSADQHPFMDPPVPPILSRREGVADYDAQVAWMRLSNAFSHGKLRMH